MILARRSRSIRLCLCNLTWITLYSSIYKLAEPTHWSARPKRLSQTKGHSLLPPLWCQVRNSCTCSYLQKECPQSMGACCLAVWVLSAATKNSANGFGKICASLVTSERCRQLEGARSLNYRWGFLEAKLLLKSRWELQADDWQKGAVQRSTFNSTRKRDLWRVMLRKQYLGKEWKIGKQHFSLMLAAATVTH